MRALVFLVGLFLAAASPSLEEQGTCVVDGAEAANELMDATIYIWASVKRCGQAGEQTKCTVDVASAVESVNAMINIILKAVDKCGSLDTTNRKCGLAASSLTQSMAGIAAASGGIIEKCPNTLKKTTAVTGANFHHAAAALCVVDLKDTMKSLFKSVKAFTTVKKACEGDDGSRKCTSNALKIVAAFAGLGEYLTGAVGHCTNQLTVASCGSEIAMLLHHLTKVSKAGLDMSKHCAPEPAPAKKEVTVVKVPVEVQVPNQPNRLYEQNSGKDGTDNNSATNLVLGAFLPVTAIVSFVGGRFYASRRSHIDQTNGIMSFEE